MATRRKSAANAGDERVRRAPAASRTDRADEDAERLSNEGLSTSTAERQALLLDEWTQRALPDPPPIKGFHLCWLSTTNQWDPIARRVRFGYVPVKASELKGFEYLKMTSGEYAGCVGINEMILFKLPEARYQAIMKEFHHDMPLGEESKIKARVDSLSEATDKTGKQMVTVVGDGFGQVVNNARPRPFD